MKDEFLPIELLGLQVSVVVCNQLGVTGYFVAMMQEHPRCVSHVRSFARLGAGSCDFREEINAFGKRAVGNRIGFGHERGGVCGRVLRLESSESIRGILRVIKFQFTARRGEESLPLEVNIEYRPGKQAQRARRVAVGELLAALELEEASVDASGEEMVTVSTRDGVWVIGEARTGGTHRRGF